MVLMCISLIVNDAEHSCACDSRSLVYPCGRSVYSGPLSVFELFVAELWDQVILTAVLKMIR